MPKIIESIPRVSYQIVCYNCGRTIEYYYNEVRGRVKKTYDDSTYFKAINCPAEDCGAEIRVEDRS